MSNKKELELRCKELGIPTENLANNTERAAAIKAKEAELAEKAKEPMPLSGGDTNPVTPFIDNVTKSEESVTKSSEAVTESQEPDTKVLKNDTYVSKIDTDVSKNDTDVSKNETKVTKSSKKSKKKSKPEAPHYEDKRGRKWKFKDKAPKTLNIGGHPMSQEEILQDEEVISELVYGNSSYLTQKQD